MSATKRILICPDTFKGTLSSLGVTQTIRDALATSTAARFEIDVAPMSDGGAGLLDSLLHGCKGLQSVAISDIVGPLGFGHRISSRFAIHPEERYAVVEMAEASGLPLVDARLQEINAAAGNENTAQQREKDPRLTTSYGTGQIMAHIAKAYPAAQIDRMYIGIGGSSTNECGFGALQALGMDIYVRNDDGAVRKLETPFTGAELARVVEIDTETDAFKTFRARFPGDKIILLCDVSNPLLGPHGATYIYGPQKGAKGKTPQSILDELEAGMTNVATVINSHIKMERKERNGTNVTDIGTMKGAGGAGGMSGGFYAILNATWQSGAEVLQDVFLRLDERIAAADIIISGEGRFDQQTIQYGKTVASIYKAMLRGIEKAKAKGNADNEKKKLFIVTCGLYQGPAMGGVCGIDGKSKSPSIIPSLCVPGVVDLHAFALSPERFSSHQAMTNTAACLKKMVEADLKPFLERYALGNGNKQGEESGKGRSTGSVAQQDSSHSASSCTSHL